MIEETKIIVRVEGLDHANARLKELAAKFPEKADRLIEDSGEKIFGDSQREVPVDTGMLKRSGVHAHERMKSTVSYNTEYSVLVHDGNSRIGPRPYLRGPAEREIPNIKKKAEKLLEG